jgi:hypothetical protein
MKKTASQQEREISNKIMTNTSRLFIDIWSKSLMCNQFYARELDHFVNFVVVLLFQFWRSRAEA